MSSGFDTFIIVDWSGGNQGSVQPQADAVWGCVARENAVEDAVYLRNRNIAEKWLLNTLICERAAGRRVFVGFDFPFGYPVGFGVALTGSDDPFTLWDWFEARIKDAPTSNNRFDLAGQINSYFGGKGPFWGNALKRDIVDLPRTKLAYENSFPNRRKAEDYAKGAFTLWQMSGVGSVGGQTMMGLPVLARLRRHFGAELTVWPFEALGSPISIVEVWPSLTVDMAPAGWIKDQWQVHSLARNIAALDRDRLKEMLNIPITSEGWIFGIGFQDELREADKYLRNDCFALPQGVHWTPVDAALDDLRSRLQSVAKVKKMAVNSCLGRVLAADVVALRANPPLSNTAIDGYGFAGGRAAGPHRLPLVAVQAAAGERLKHSIPSGSAIRILTGAALPDGVDTVILQEDVEVADGFISFVGPLDVGANTRAALRKRLDEAVSQADIILTSGGASSGDEDHVSGLLNETGAMALWRIAIKPGRPLALGVWRGKPIFGLPGNPVAAMVCTLVFAAPAFAQMAGSVWMPPQGFQLPAAFSKQKKSGRREFLRARVRDGKVEVFVSEGSGRISSLAWAEGLVELPEDALHIHHGDMVRYIPWSGFNN